MPRTRLSLYYPIGYLLFSGVFMMLAPRLALQLLLSNGDYGEVMPRLAGVLMVGLGLIVLQIVRHEVEVLYPSLVGVRAFFLPCRVALFLYSRAPLFVVLFLAVGLGFAWSLLSMMRERAA